MGYECRECGYEPSPSELRMGVCPDCSWYRRIDRYEAEQAAAIEAGDAEALVKLAERWKRMGLPDDARKALEAAGKIVRPPWARATTEQRREFYTLLRVRLAA